MKKFQITFKGQVYELDVEEIGGAASAGKKAVSSPVLPAAPAPAQAPAPKAAPAAVPAGAQTVLAPMPGKILTVNIKPGDSVKRGQVIFILEAMKMQNEIMANQDGKISKVNTAVGQTVSTGDVLAVLG
ncbi:MULTISPECIES: biotin/lipoyl-containing protein [Pelosinus]|jgi:glutaconyl-CoA decarboxylase|uniref:Biotin/lipoyl attachment domain-containing protein n=1 Tax=Pelosinus fermentans B4 TaxID=1149862 RepID=I9L964_9FIRM|nr:MULTISPECIES: biotin/lipoyl-containing protein [Pelosinus]EIW16914.1 biotin/lipoyl attachment domain-containing protein [Pelosinus fermentans B4]EIW22895.1 biotin/lipoyl attachment domain-containing protein [Pelosinus fermentans A11]OAM93747.1 biotin/lipoyl attachment domain-containing protein [Pelosinus fermentans DSM 17108]SDQ88664.1 glutaconyl-CoA decarboxylase [Pelosinus fermentans]